MRAGHWAQVSACVFSVFSLYVYLAFPTQFIQLCDEDGAIENLTALCFFAAGIAFVYLNRGGAFRSLCCAGLAVLCVLVAGEEISWGQRILGLQTPQALREVNVQQELNFHNLQWLQGSYRLIMIVFLLSFCLMLPVAIRYNRRIRDFVVWLGCPVYPGVAVPAILLAVAFMAVPRLLNVENFRDLDEIGELLVSFGFLVYALAPETPESVVARPLVQSG